MRPRWPHRCRDGVTRSRGELAEHADLPAQTGEADPLPGVVYLLVCGPLVCDPLVGHGGRVGTGWVLEAWERGRRGWSEPLAGRGAAPSAAARVAQAVAVRVLGGHGVAVRDWHPAGAEDRPVFRARLRCAAAPDRSGPRPNAARSAPA